MLSLIITIAVIAIIVITIYNWLRKKGFLFNTNKEDDKTKSGAYTIDDRYNELRKNRQEELDTLLEKISKYGYRSLSIKEQERLKKLSK